MKSRVGLVVFACLLLSQQAVAQQAPAQERSNKNPFDLSAANEALGQHVASVASVKVLEDKAQQLFDANDCKNALDALDKYAREANALSNMIVRGLDPFYTASYDDRRGGFVNLSVLGPFENLGNEYKRKRNHAMVMQAECLVKLGQQQRAAATYYQALGLIDIKDSDWWTRARSGLYNLIQVDTKK